MVAQPVTMDVHTSNKAIVAVHFMIKQGAKPALSIELGLPVLFLISLIPGELPQDANYKQ